MGRFKVGLVLELCSGWTCSLYLTPFSRLACDLFVLSYINLSYYFELFMSIRFDWGLVIVCLCGSGTVDKVGGAEG